MVLFICILFCVSVPTSAHGRHGRWCCAGLYTRYFGRLVCWADKRHCRQCTEMWWFWLSMHGLWWTFDKCYHNPDMCTKAITMSFWVSQINYQGQIYTTGAFPYDSVGYLIDFPDPRYIGFHTWHNTSHDSYIMTGWAGDDQWRHLLITWYLGEGITVYINGCDADPEKIKGYAKTESRRRPNTQTIKDPILIGRALAMNAYLMLDEFLIWHKRLSPEQIWQLYTQGC